VRLASQDSGESHQTTPDLDSLGYVRSSRIHSGDAIRPDLAILRREEAQELLAGAAKEVLRLD
jgi:hypothetical protein